MQIANFTLIIFEFISLYHILTIYQQAHYEIKEYLRYTIRHPLIEIYSLLVIILGIIFNNVVFLAIAYLFLGITAFFIYGKKRVKLKVTKRIKRSLILFIVGIILITYYYPLVPLIRYVMVIAMLISNKIEGLINSFYLKKTINKRKKYQGICIGITGSYAKTTTKFYLSHIMESLYPLSTIKSYNTLNGISLVINQANLELYDFMILEMGASKKNDIKELCEAFRPNIGIVTAIGPMHLNTFKSIEIITKEKMRLIESLGEKGLGIINYENEYIRNYKLSTKAYVITYGINYGDFRAKIVNDKVIISYLNKEVFGFFKHNLDNIDIINLLPCIILGMIFKIDYKEIIKQIETLKRPKSRQEIIRYKNTVIIDDSYNSNIDGAINAISKMKNYKGKKIIITPGIVESDKCLDKIYQRYSMAINEYIDEAYIVRCSVSSKLYDNISINKKYVKSVNEALNCLDYNKNLVILIENDIPDIYI